MSWVPRNFVVQVGEKVIAVSDHEFEIIVTRLKLIFINQNRNHDNQHVSAREKLVLLLFKLIIPVA